MNRPKAILPMISLVMIAMWNMRWNSSMSDDRRDLHSDISELVVKSRNFCCYHALLNWVNANIMNNQHIELSHR
jgi:hypothetical protein